MTPETVSPVRAVASSRGASRATIVLGYASLGGVIGIVGGTIGSFKILGMGMPDDADGLPFIAMACGGLGWALGAGLGRVVGRAGRPLGTFGRRVTLAGAAVVVLGALMIAASPAPVGWPEGGVSYFSLRRAWSGGAPFEIALLVDAAVAVLTILAVRRYRGDADSARPRRIAGATAIAGLVVGCAAFILGLGIVRMEWSDTLDQQRYQAVYRTTSSLANAASRRLDRTGSFPTTLEEALAAGARVQPGVTVAFAGVVDGSFCVRVGTTARDGGTGEPHYSALVHRRPKRAHEWVSSELWAGDSCVSA